MCTKFFLGVRPRAHERSAGIFLVFLVCFTFSFKRSIWRTQATTQVTKAGVFMLPGLVKIKTRVKPATKAGKREIFGKMVVVKAKPARKIVKAFPLAALKKSV